jgi:isopentenyl diphosphate isomerase/L-lactate dehydrogenase-like FMN-dependent dehydrogenase
VCYKRGERGRIKNEGWVGDEAAWLRQAEKRTSEGKNRLSALRDRWAEPLVAVGVEAVHEVRSKLGCDPAGHTTHLV